jgi:peptide/nickel transport system substrate-binding protein
MSSGNGGTVDDLGLESLLRFRPNGTLEPWLATSMTRVGKNVIVFHLRHGVKFWDGQEMTSADVANALNYYRYPKFVTVVNFKSVKSVVAKDKYTVVVTLRHPDASFLNHVPGSVVFEKKFQQTHGANMGKPGVLEMGTGPWEFDSFDPNTGVEFSANPHWWGGTVPYKHVSLKWFSTETSMALAMRAGDVDAVPFVFAPTSFASTSTYKVLTKPHCTVWNFSMNTKAAPWSDIHVRRAVAYALNRQDIVRAHGGAVLPADQMIPTSQLLTLAPKAKVDALLKSLPRYPYNLTKAKAELAKSAYPHGFSGSLTATDYGSFLTDVQALTGDLAKIGIHLKVNNESLGAWVAEMTGPRDKIGAEFIAYGCISPDPSYYPGILLGSKAAAQGAFGDADYAPAGLDSLLQQALQASGTRRLALYGKILKMVDTDLPYIPVLNLEAAYAVDHKVTWTDYSYFDNLTGPWALNVKPK